MNLDLIEHELARAGLNLFSVVDFPVVEGGVSARSESSALLVGSTGNLLWEQMPGRYLGCENPIDEYSREIIGSVMEEHASTCEWEFLFPLAADDYEAPNLQQLGVAAGWHHASPLGIGINGRYGLWFGYRAVLRLGKKLKPSEPLDSVSPCLTCVEMPCLRSCPAEALNAAQPPDLTACSNWRAVDQSSCASTCQARLSCPVAPQWRYSELLLAYYYDYSLPSLIQWVHSGAE